MIRMLLVLMDELLYIIIDVIIRLIMVIVAPLIGGFEILDPNDSRWEEEVEK